uniref:Site-specific DNA endonuclease n=1 Tax=Romanomermis culicivorax TaxID=13658 RepID=A0A915KPJ7_ROMCU
MIKPDRSIITTEKYVVGSIDGKIYAEYFTFVYSRNEEIDKSKIFTKKDRFFIKRDFQANKAWSRHEKLQNLTSMHDLQLEKHANNVSQECMKLQITNFFARLIRLSEDKNIHLFAGNLTFHIKSYRKKWSYGETRNFVERRRTIAISRSQLFGIVYGLRKQL